MLKRNKKFILSGLLILMSFIIIYAGLFLSFGEKEGVIEKKETPKPFPILYKHISTVFSGYKQKINILEVNPRDKRVEIKPALSYDSIFGFEKLSSIASRNKAYGIINAGFFYEHGNPSGMVAIDGKILNMNTGRFPVLMLNNGLAELKEVRIKVTLSNGSNIVNIDNINTYMPTSGIILYTPEFGNDNRVNRSNISITIVNNQIKSIKKSSGKTPIPNDGMVITFLNPNNKSVEDLPLKIGDIVKLEYSPMPGDGFNAYECGSWLVKDGKAVIGEMDPWVGVMTNHDPRTIVGIKDNGHVVFLTVDGRQPGYSVGMTGKELAAFALSYGLNNAAMLDGGASTEMIVKGKIVNRLSGGGTERPVGGGIIVRVDS